MPTYDFKCLTCEKRFSKFVSYKEKDQVTCPECNGKTQQLFTGFLYKKSGGDTAGGGTSCTKSSCKGCGGC
ncbi:MAG: zinc ribbon domain-containing protein [Bacillota bacterium]